MPSAAACCHKLLIKLFPAAPCADSHSPKLSVITGARLLLTIYCAESIDTVARIRRCRNHKFDRYTFGHRSGPLNIEIGFCLLIPS